MKAAAARASRLLEQVIRVQARAAAGVAAVQAEDRALEPTAVPEQVAELAPAVEQADREREAGVVQALAEQAAAAAQQESTGLKA